MEISEYQTLAYVLHSERFNAPGKGGGMHPTCITTALSLYDYTVKPC